MVLGGEDRAPGRKEEEQGKNKGRTREGRGEEGERVLIKRHYEMADLGAGLRRRSSCTWHDRAEPVRLVWKRKDLGFVEQQHLVACNLRTHRGEKAMRCPLSCDATRRTPNIAPSCSQYTVRGHSQCLAHHSHQINQSRPRLQCFALVCVWMQEVVLSFLGVEGALMNYCGAVRSFSVVLVFASRNFPFLATFLQSTQQKRKSPKNHTHTHPTRHNQQRHSLSFLAISSFFFSIALRLNNLILECVAFFLSLFPLPLFVETLGSLLTTSIPTHRHTDTHTHTQAACPAQFKGASTVLLLLLLLVLLVLQLLG